MSGLESDKLLDKLAAKPGPKDEVHKSFRMKVLGYYEEGGCRFFVLSPDVLTETLFKKKVTPKNAKGDKERLSILGRVRLHFGEAVFSFQAKPGKIHFLKIDVGMALSIKGKILEEVGKCQNSKRDAESWQGFFDVLDGSPQMSKEKLENLWQENNDKKGPPRNSGKTAEARRVAKEKRREVLQAWWLSKRPRVVEESNQAEVEGGSEAGFPTAPESVSAGEHGGGGGGSGAASDRSAPAGQATTFLDAFVGTSADSDDDSDDDFGNLPIFNGDYDSDDEAGCRTTIHHFS